MTDEEKKRLAARVAAQSDAGGSSTNGRLSAPNTNSAMTGLRTGEDLEKGYSRHAVLENGVPSGGGVGVSQTPVDGTQTIPQEIPDGSTVMTMGDGNKGVVTPQGQTLVPNAEECRCATCSAESSSANEYKWCYSASARELCTDRNYTNTTRAECAKWKGKV